MMDGIPARSNKPDGNGLARQRRTKRRGVDEARGVLGHDHLHTNACLLQTAKNLAALIGGDTARHPDQHAWLLNAHRRSPSSSKS